MGWVLIVWALLAGQPVSASHTFMDPTACAKVRELVVRQLVTENAVNIHAMCSPIPGDGNVQALARGVGSDD